MINNCRYLLNVDDNRITVNNHTLLDHDQPARSNLTFQLLNPDRVNQIEFYNPRKLTSEAIVQKLQNHEAVRDTSYIRFFFPCGEGEGDFIDEERGKMIEFEMESGDWSAAEGIIEDGYISFVISSYNQKILGNLFSIYFKCRNIQSYAPLGLTYVYAEIKNVVGIQNVTKVFPIQKIPAPPHIKRFFSNKTTLGPSGTIRLNWEISGATEGQISPGNMSIFQLPAPGVDVALNRNLEYRLALKGNGLESDALINLYVLPPDILQLDYDPGASQVIWRTQYGDDLQLAVGTVTTPVNNSGTLKIKMPDKPQIVLRAHGDMYTEYAALNLQGLTFDPPQQFRSQIRVYTHYIHTKWEWETQGTKTVSFQFTEDGSVWHEASVVGTGQFEYVSETPPLGAKLMCTQNDGTSYPVLQLDGEVK